ncbi:hypothetical protein TNCV_1611571 [Trichonephila clavipes]|nr:hypothetical protein TNCV_1611571 [Trichonephila clavipes]
MIVNLVTRNDANLALLPRFRQILIEPPFNVRLIRWFKYSTVSRCKCGHGSLVIKISDRGWLVTNSTPVPQKTRCVGQRCTLNLSRAQKSSRRCHVVVERKGASSGVLFVT